MIDPRLLNSLVAAMGGGSYYPYDYSDLSPEEAAEMKFIDNCLFGCSERISHACSKIQLLILEYATRFNNDTMSDEEFFSLTCVQLLDMLDDQILKDIAYNKFYPGNTYAFDTCSDSEVYTTDEKGKLVEVNIIEEPGFMEAFKKALYKDAEWTDNYRKNNE